MLRKLTARTLTVRRRKSRRSARTLNEIKKQVLAAAQLRGSIDRVATGRIGYGDGGADLVSFLDEALKPVNMPPIRAGCPQRRGYFSESGYQSPIDLTKPAINLALVH